MKLGAAAHTLVSRQLRQSRGGVAMRGANCLAMVSQHDGRDDSRSRIAYLTNPVEQFKPALLQEFRRMAPKQMLRRAWRRVWDFLS